MNIYSFFGFIIAGIVLFVGLKLSTSNLGMFLDYPSMFIVVGASLAATALSYQINRIFVLVKIFFRRIFFSRKKEFRKIIIELIEIAESYRQDKSPEELAETVREPFLKEALVLVADNILEREKIINLLNKRVKNNFQLQLDEANKLKFVAKFPPAFGMMGTTIGMVVLLSNLGGPDAMQTIGPAMAVCLITTLYGVILANMVFIPMSENLIEDTKDNLLKNKIIVEGVRLMLDKTNPIEVAETLNSFLEPEVRVDWKKVISGAN
jgi:chemotaxis protein MotA